MQIHQIENWTLQVIDQVINGQPNEDTRVELKSKWPDPVKAARRIAGLANAARGAPVLWIIGVDEKARVIIGAEPVDLAGWYPQVESQFDGLAPHLIDLNIPYKGKTVVALYFETTRRPFVVKNPAYGKSKGGPVSLETPWREGTRVRSARREELMRLLSPLQALPSFEVLSGRLVCREKNHDDVWELEINLYAEVDILQPVVIPFHRCELSVTLEDGIQIPFPSLKLSPPYARTGMRPRDWSWENLSKTIEGTQDEVLLHGPGRLRLVTNNTTPPFEIKAGSKVFVNATIVPVHAEQAVPISLTLISSDPGKNQRYHWSLQPSS